MSNDMKIAAAQATLSLSGLLVTVASVMLTIGAASATFVATTFKTTPAFWVFFLLAMAFFGCSIIFSGRGTTEVRDRLFANSYDTSAGKQHFNCQALTCYFALLFYFFSFLMIGDQAEKSTQEEIIRLSRETKTLESAVRELQWTVGTLRQQ